MRWGRQSSQAALQRSPDLAKRFKNTGKFSWKYLDIRHRFSLRYWLNETCLCLEPGWSEWEEWESTCDRTCCFWPPRQAPRRSHSDPVSSFRALQVVWSSHAFTLRPNWALSLVRSFPSPPTSQAFLHLPPLVHPSCPPRTTTVTPSSPALSSPKISPLLCYFCTCLFSPTGFPFSFFLYSLRSVSALLLRTLPTPQASTDHWPCGHSFEAMLSALGEGHVELGRQADNTASVE